MKVRLMSSLLLLGSVCLTSCGDIPPYDLDTETEIIVGMEADYAPFNWSVQNANNFTHPLSGRPGHVDGYDVQVSKIIALGLNKSLVIKVSSFDGLIPALRAGQIDLAIAGMSPTATRAKQVAFSEEYYRSECVMVVSSSGAYASATSIAEFSGARVVAQLATLYVDLIDQIPNVIALPSLGSYAALQNAVSSGAADAFIGELPVAQGIVAADNSLSIVRLTNGGFVIDDSEIVVSVAMRKQDTALLEAINTILATISEEQRNNLMSEALNRSEE